MIELKNDELVFSFPKLHPSAVMRIQFQRTLRIPDDDKEYPLPPGLGGFPLKHVDDFAASVRPSWMERGGVMLPMYQSEAMWINFDADEDEERGVPYPFAVKIATGKINAVSGQTWREGFSGRKRQDYLVVPEQPWIDGYCVGKGVIRQFVAMPLGAGYTAEEQITDKAEYGGIQIAVFPMKLDIFKKRFPKRSSKLFSDDDSDEMVCFDKSCCYESMEMGLAPGGRMKQEIYDDPYGFAEWDADNGRRCFVHIANSMVWRQVTGEPPPTTPPTAKEYANAGLPWFMWYNDKQTAIKGSQTLAGMKSVANMGKKKKDVPLPENQTVDPGNVIALRRGLKKGQVREFKN